jgi:hypothetical protein
MVIDDERLSEMLQDTGCELWHDSHIDGQLRLRVGDNYEALSGTLKEIREMLVEVQKVLMNCFGKLLLQVRSIYTSCPTIDPLHQSICASDIR